jgi:ABC-type nickel/cobalt efflux system permease component RcnA
VAVTLLAFTANAQQQHAHTHGHVELNVAVDEQSITFQIEAPLDNFLGFERAPRTDAERKRVADMVARLEAADRLLQPDPRAECRLAKVDLDSEVLGLGHGEHEEEEDHDHDKKGEAHGHGHDHDGEEDGEEHADIDMTIVFSCAKAAAARFVDIKLFDAFPGIRDIEAQIASPQGQFKRDLKPATPRLEWGR